MKSVYKILLLVTFIWLCVLSYFIIVPAEKKNSRRIAYIDNYKVFDAFDYKKIQDTALYDIEQKVSLEIDSLTRELNKVRSMLSQDAKSEELLLRYNSLKKEYSAARQNAEKVIKSESTRLTNEVYKKLNEYIDEFGKMKSLDIVLGSDGTGSVMYVDSTINITDEVIKYVNKRFNES